jgi:hypothetical protein
MKFIRRQAVLALQAKRIRFFPVIKKPAADPANLPLMDINLIQALPADYLFFRFKEKLTAKLAEGRENSQLNRHGQPVN